MFTGIIEKIGKLTSVENISGGKRFKISCGELFDDLKIGHSVSVDGVCLTVTELSGDSFFSDAVGATLEKTTLSDFKTGRELNLERAMKIGDRLGGHIVQGHVNGVGTLSRIVKLGENYSLEIAVPPNLTKYIIDEGSIAVDGVSLTVAKIVEDRITISLIPHTWNATNMRNRKTGDKVNLETDVLAKYVEKNLFGNKEEKDKFSDNWFKKLGY